MQNNSLYNINNNKIAEDQLNTMMATGKKITRPSDDPVIAIRALRLRSNVTQLSQYYEKNAKDAESWLNVTADALSTITSVLTDCVKQATKGSNKDLTLDDLETIVTQMEALSKEYYATGNVDYAGRYIFTGYRTDTPLTFDKTTTADYKNINDEFQSRDITDSSRIIGKHLLDSSSILDDTSPTVYESDIVERTVGRLRLSYDNLNYANEAGRDSGAVIKWREQLKQPATSSVTTARDVISLTYETKDNQTRFVNIPIDDKEQYKVTCEGVTYTAVTNTNGTYTITAVDEAAEETGIIKVSADGIVESFDGNIDSAITAIESRQISAIAYTSEQGVYNLELPLLPAIGQSYTMNLDIEGFTATINSDGTYTIVDGNRVEYPDGTYTNTVIQITGNGSVNSSYKETSFEIDAAHTIYSTSGEAEIDAAYEDLYSHPDGIVAYLNASTGELLLNDNLTNTLSNLPDLINARSIDMVYNKKEWVDGDIRPENLFACDYTDSYGQEILYNKGSGLHNIAYDVGFAQSVVVNTTADAVFTTDVRRNVSDLSRILDELKQVESMIKTLNDKLDAATEEDHRNKLKSEIDAATKAYDFMREEIQQEFERKITSMQKCLDTANIAVTDNGTRSKRLDLVNSRLMTQTTTFKTLKSENEDIDLAEAATQLTTAQVTYEASLMATGKISQASLMNYI
jgi:flagellar hook-associated protein 3 FlgL